MQTTSTVEIPDLDQKLHGRRTIALYILVLSLLVPYGIILGADLSLRTGLVDIESENWFHWIQIGIGFCILALCGLFLFIDWIMGKTHPGARRIVRWICTILLCIGLIFILSDEPEDQFPYTWQDVPATSADNLESYELIVEHMTGPNPAIDIENSGDILKAAMDAPLVNETGIMKAWESAQAGRSLIENLDRFDQIADLAMPDNAVDISIMQIEFLARVYRAYALLMAEKGAWHEGVAQLGRIHAVAIKALPFARYLINKIIWTVIVERNIKIAFQLAQQEKASLEDLRQLALAFPPLDERAVSFRGALISETMFMLHFTQSADTREELRAEICASSFYGDICDNWWHATVLRTLLMTCYRPQASKNLIKSHMIPLIQACSHAPPHLTEANAIWLTANKPVFGNTMGWIFINSSLGDFSHYPKRLAETKVMSDLLSLYLQSRIGETTGEKDYLCEGTYLSTKDPGIFKSAGWDCLADTKDDLALITEHD